MHPKKEYKQNEIYLLNNVAYDKTFHTPVTGKVLSFFEDGKHSIKSELTYIDGKLNRTSIYYNENGVAWRVSQFKDNKLNGITRYFYENGALQNELIYKDNVLNGLKRYFDKSGKLYQSTLYFKGKRIDTRCFIKGRKNSIAINKNKDCTPQNIRNAAIEEKKKHNSKTELQKIIKRKIAEKKKREELARIKAEKEAERLRIAKEKARIEALEKQRKYLNPDFPVEDSGVSFSKPKSKVAEETKVDPNAIKSEFEKLHNIIKEDEAKSLKLKPQTKKPIKPKEEVKKIVPKINTKLPVNRGY